MLPRQEWGRKDRAVTPGDCIGSILLNGLAFCPIGGAGGQFGRRAAFRGANRRPGLPVYWDRPRRAYRWTHPRIRLKRQAFPVLPGCEPASDLADLRWGLRLSLRAGAGEEPLPYIFTNPRGSSSRSTSARPRCRKRQSPYWAMGQVGNLPGDVCGAPLRHGEPLGVVAISRRLSV